MTEHIDSVLEAIEARNGKNDTADRHSYYRGLEPKDVIEAWKLDFHLGCVVKYIGRAGKKTTDPLPDLWKALWSLARAIRARTCKEQRS